MQKRVVIATHDGMFHADDAFAVATLLLVLDKTPVVPTVVRTRDEEIIRAADFVVDVGGVSDPEKNRFDHHQQGGAGKRPNAISYASFGLVWRKFGESIAGSPDTAERVEQTLVCSIDAHDNGVDTYAKVFPDVTPYTVNEFVHHLRPTWQEPPAAADAQFLQTVAFARTVLEREILHANAAVAAESLVRKAYTEAPDKRIIIFDALYPCEEILAQFSEPLFVVAPRPDGRWNARTIRNDVSVFKNRKDFPAEWAGKRDAELAALTGVSDAVFCHTGRFMVVAKSKEGAFALAEKALMS